MTTESSRSMPLLAHDDLNGFGNCGEGMAIQMARDGRRILWLAHESPPKNVTAVDVTDPRKPTIVLQTDLPHREMRSNSLDLVGDLLVVAYQTSRPGMQPAGFEIFDVADPARPRSVATFDASGPASRGVHHLWFVDGSYVHLSGGAADFVPRNPKDDQCYRIVDVRNPSRPHEVGRWWLPGTRDGDAEPPPTRHPRFDMGFRAHNTNVYPRRPDRAYVGYIDGGAIILDISDMARPRLVSRWDYHPPFPGLHPHAPAALRPGAARGLRRVHGGRRGRLAQARVGPGRPRRGEPGPDQHLSRSPPSPTSRGAAAAMGPTTSTRTGRRRDPGSRRRSWSARSSTAASAPSTSPTRSALGKSPTTSRRRRAAHRAARPS